jgi:hypothetical protein
MNAQFSTRLRFRIALWCQARLLPIRTWRSRPLKAVLALANPAPGESYEGLTIDYVVRHVVRTTRRPFLMRDRRCLRQGLLAYRFLNAAGGRPELHFGVDRGSLHGPMLRAHCWVVEQGQVVLNPPQPNLLTVLVHSAERTAVADSSLQLSPKDIGADIHPMAGLLS